MLRTLHEESAKFTQRLHYVEKSREKNQITLNTDRETLEAMKGAMEDNMKLVKINIETLNNRLDLLETRKE